MNNHRDILGLIVNIIVVAVILCTIVVGLNRIGIYDLPDGLEKILGTYEEKPSDTHIVSGDITDSIDYEEKGDIKVSSVDLTYESARELLSQVEPVSDYTHMLTVEHTDSKGSVHKESVSVVCENGLYDAAIFNVDSEPIKHIKESEDTVEIEDISDGNSIKISVPRGEFDISDECGFVLTAANFLDSDYVLDEASYSVSNGTYGAQVKIVFDTTMGEYTQTETYVISLDYGVVISAECYENEKLIYTMKTRSLVMN